MNKKIAIKIKLKKKDKSRQKILDAAIVILAQKGFESTSFQNIADYCEMTQKGVLNHFKNKKELFIAILMKIQEEMYQHADGLFLSTDTCIEKFEKHFETNFQVVKNHPERMQVYIVLYYYASFDPEFMKMYQKILHKVHERLVGYIEEGKSQYRFNFSSQQMAEVFHAYTIGAMINMVASGLTASSEKTMKDAVRTLIKSMIIPKAGSD